MDVDVNTLTARGYQARREGQSAEAHRLFSEAVCFCRSNADSDRGGRSMLALALAGLGQIERDLGHGEIARQLYAESVDLYRTMNNPLKLAHTVRHLGDILRESGDSEVADPCYQEALEIYRHHVETPPLDLANAVAGYARLKAKTRDSERAGTLWREARAIYQSLSLAAGVEEADTELARLHRST